MRASWTAQGAAAQRAVLTDLGALDDPLARQMLGRPMATLAWALGRLPRAAFARSVTLAGAAGSQRWFDAVLVEALDDGVEQVAILGAGYDARSWRFARDGVRFVELDHAATQREKVRVASALGPGPTFVAADLSTDDAATALGAALDLGRPTLAIVEAVTMYLDEAVVRRQLAGLAEALAPGSRLAVNVLPATSPDSGRNRRQLRLQRLARTGTDEHYRCRLDPDAARELLEACGWTVREQITFAEAAERFVPRSTRLPIEAVDPRKTCWLATLPG